MEYLLDLAPLVAIVVVLLGVLVWWRRHKKRKAERAHAEEVAAFASALGGRVAGPDDVRPWSAELLAPLRDETDGVINRMGVASRRRYTTAVDLRRGPWSVRVGEASVEKSRDNGTRTAREQRIEVATAPLAPTRIGRRVHGGRTLLGPDRTAAEGGGLVREVPVTVAAAGGGWHRVAFPPGPFDAGFAVFTSDPAAAVRALHPRAVEHLLAVGHDLPFTLHFEAGLVFGTIPGPMEPDRTTAAVDAIVGLLDRMGAIPVDR
ncbi:hypothetical protein AB0G02_01705 [Actinosynnema sp. NPDC023658]|uniref:hypothetical protein n=1 Tax=Actinosynnema sp. NPDC023658 TaxID=3155465 RepID=UPI0033E04413